MSLFDYQPGELSLLLNPTATPDVYHQTKPAAPVANKSNKRTFESADQHDRRSKKKRLDKTQSVEDEQQHSSHKQQRSRVREQTEAGQANESDEHDEVDVDDEDEDETQHDNNNDDDDDSDGDLSDLSDMDDSQLYADMDPTTARQLRKQKRLQEDQHIEQQQQPHNKHKPTTQHAADPRLPRTLFVGNVPTSTTRQQLTRLLKQFGSVESCRIRSFSVSNPKLPRRVAAIKGAIHPDSQSMNAYVVYEEEESVERAVGRSGLEYEGHKLRLDYADSSKSTVNKAKLGVSAGLSVFVGNLPFNVSEQRLYEVFEGCGELTGVRVVRDPLLALGKGFAFVTFDSTAAVKKALAMQGVAIDGRELRLTRAMDETKARELRDKRRKEVQQPAAAGAARRLQERVKHAERKAAAAAAVGGKSERKGKVYVGEVSNPLEYVQKARRVEKKQKMKKEERRKKRSLVKVKKPRMKPAAESDSGAAASKKANTDRKDKS